MEVESVSASNFEFPELMLNVKLEQQDHDMLDTNDVLEMTDTFKNDVDYGQSDGDDEREEDDFGAGSTDEDVKDNIKDNNSELELYFINVLNLLKKLKKFKNICIYHTKLLVRQKKIFF